MPMYCWKIGKQNATLKFLKCALYVRPVMTFIWLRNLKMENLIFADKTKAYFATLSLLHVHRVTLPLQLKISKHFPQLR